MLIWEKKQHKTLSKKSYLVKPEIFTLNAISMRLCGDDKEETRLENSDPQRKRLSATAKKLAEP